MRLIKKMLKGYAVYWPPKDGNKSGQVSFGDPVEIRCRWTDTLASPVSGSGTAEESMTRVYVDRPVEMLGVLWEGKLADVPDLAGKPPTRLKKAFEIRKYKEVKTLKYNQSIKIAFL